MSRAEFWSSPTFQVVKAMKARGNRPGVVREWKNLVAEWAKYDASADAAAVNAMLPLWQDRPAYTAAELAPMFPALAIALGIKTFSGGLPRPLGPARLAAALKFAGLPYRIARGREYFLVERIHYWREAPQDEFEWEIFGA